MSTAMPALRVIAASCLALAASAHAGELPAHGLPLRGEEAEAFLRNARVVKKKGIGVGITRPYQLTLSDGAHTLKAAWKTIDEFKRGVTQFQQGGFEVDFRDSYKHEVAAYELDKLLGFELVPPTVAREIDGEKGSLQMWVVDARTELDRKRQKLRPPDAERWNQQMLTVRLLHQLTFNTDHANIRNVLFDPDFRIYAIDFSRAFRGYDELMSEKDLTRFSRRALEGLRGLRRDALHQKLAGLVGRPELDALLKRRDRILKRAEQLVAERGEAAVMFP
jgi:hypothetical protein